MSERVNDEVKQANKKALPKFLLLILCSALVGFAAGLFMAFAGDGVDLPGALNAAGAFFCERIAPWLLCAVMVVVPAVTLPVYLSAKKLAEGWNGEDEAVSDRVDEKLSVVLWFSNLMFITGFFLVGAVYSRFDVFLESNLALFGLSVAAFIVVLAESIVLQQRAVDLTKRMNPEKQGSVYEVKFQKKWLDSCDEAEKVLIGKCAYKAYTAVNNTCMALCLILALSALSLGIGFLPLLSVCIVWAVGQTVYYLESRRLSGHGTTVL